jgi:hypothetical protein
MTNETPSGYERLLGAFKDLADDILTPLKPARRYRVSVWTSVDVEARSEEEAENIAHDMVLTQAIRMRDYEFTAEEA